MIEVEVGWLLALRDQIRRLTPNTSNPEAFFERRSDIADEIGRLLQPAPRARDAR